MKITSSSRNHQVINQSIGSQWSEKPGSAIFGSNLHACTVSYRSMICTTTAITYISLTQYMLFHISK